MQLEDLFTIFGKENVKVLSDDPELQKSIEESNHRINEEMESFSTEHRAQSS